MTRRSFDVIVSWVGILLTAVLVVAGGLAFWGYSFANGRVHDQLAAQKIFIPPKGNEALADPRIGKYLNQYAGQQLTNGAQAISPVDQPQLPFLKDFDSAFSLRPYYWMTLGLVITGCVTELGMFVTAADAMMRGFHVEVPPDCQAGSNPMAEQFALTTLSVMRPVEPM